MHRRSKSSTTSPISITTSSPVVAPRNSGSYERNSAYASPTTPRRNSVSTPLAPVPAPVVGVDLLAMETEQEAIFNKLQREINFLKDRRGSASDAQQVSHFRKTSLAGTEEYGISPTSTASVFSVYMPNSVSSSSLSSVSSAVSHQDNTGRERRGSIRRGSVCAEDYEKLKQENEMLKNKLRDLTLRLADKEHEVDMLRHKHTAPMAVKMV